MKLTYKSLFQLVNEEISKSKTYSTKSGYSSQLSRTGVTPVSSSASGEVNISQIVSSIQTFLTNSLPSFIRDGLLVTATDPITSSVTISAGSGVAAGFLYTLSEDLTVEVPFDATNTVFFLNFYQNNIQFDKTEDPKKLTIAKIVIPQPGTTAFVRDVKDGSPDAYIINYTEYKLHGDGNGNFEEDTVELLRQNIGPILADNLIGNIRLNQDLKITNTQGTLELDSNELRILNTDGDILAKFNKNGTFFYDQNGIEIAKFASNEARVGNIIVQTDNIRSGNYVEDYSGFIIRDSGDAEFENVKIRGAFHTSVFVKDTVSALGGIFMVIESDTLDADMTALDSSTLTIKGNIFPEVGDILRIKDADDDEWFEVTSVASAPTYTVTRDKKSFYASNNNPAWTAGAAVINYKQTGNGYIYMTASDETAPYISVTTHAGSPWAAQTERLRLGRLDGFLDYPEEGDSDYAGPYYGIAIGELTKYLKYDPDGGLVIRGDFTMDAGFIGGAEGWQIIGNEIIGSTHSSIRGGQTGYAEGSGFFLGYDDGSGDADAYKLSIGDTNNYVKWDGENLYIKGSLIMGPGSTIESGVISADAFVDTVVGDLSIGATFAKKTLDSQIKWTQFQTQSMLDEPTATYDCPSGQTFETAEGILQIPTSRRWDVSGEYWDETGATWDSTSVLGTYIFTSEVKDIGANFNNMPIMVATKQVNGTNTVTVEVDHSEDNITWDGYESAYPTTQDGVTTWYLGNIVKARYLKYRITFEVTDNSVTTYLSNIYFKTLALYKTVLFPDITFYSTDNRELNDLDQYFSKEFTVSIQPQGTSSLIRSQIVSKTSPPSSIVMRLVNESNAAVDGTADVTLIGY